MSSFLLLFQNQGKTILLIPQNPIRICEKFGFCR